jgi:hypothetical protein
MIYIYEQSMRPWTIYYVTLFETIVLWLCLFCCFVGEPHFLQGYSLCFTKVKKCFPIYFGLFLFYNNIMFDMLFCRWASLLSRIFIVFHKGKEMFSYLIWFVSFMFCRWASLLSRIFLVFHKGKGNVFLSNLVCFFSTTTYRCILIFCSHIKKLYYNLLTITFMLIDNENMAYKMFTLNTKVIAAIAKERSSRVCEKHTLHY